MEKKYFGKKSKEQWHEFWRKALEVGECPFESCEIKTATCKHLDHYLKWGHRRFYKDPGIDVMFDEQIDQYGDAEKIFSNTQGVWRLFKVLRRFDLTNDQVRILVRKFGLGMGRPAILRELGWKSHRGYDKLVANAIRTIKASGRWQQETE